MNSTGAFLILSVLNISEIFSADSGMNGWRRVAICLIDSTNWYKTFLLCVSQGFLSWMNSLQMSMNANISFRDLSSSKLSIWVFIFFRFSFLISVFDVFVIPYFSARVDVRETRFPSLFASSLLCRSISSFSEKSKSSNVEPRSRLYRIVSTGYFFASSIGSIVLPRDFDIFWPLNVRYPWTRSFFGSSISADISIAGQIIEWNQLIPFPMTWTSAGQLPSAPDT